MASMISHRGSHPSDSFAQLLAVSNTRRNEQQALKAEAVFLSSLETNAKTSQPPSKPKKRARKYSRKEKSLGMLCGRFLHLYEGKAGVSICLDEAAQTLGVERRRIYDIVNILESVEIVSRRGKNQYEWHGRGRLGESLKQIKVKRKARLYRIFQKVGSSVQLSLQRDIHFVVLVISSRRDSRREKSLGLLSRRFVQMFFSSDSRVVSLDEAGSALVDDRPQTNVKLIAKSSLDALKSVIYLFQKKPGAYKSKVRRLYDIANVYLVEPRKAAFMWLGAGVFPLNSNIQDDTYVASQETLVPSGSSKSNSSSDEKIRRMDDASSTTQSSTDRVFQPRRIKSFLQLSPSE
eukprot:1339790-Amorphochlora_amoeboformis.AAC.1